MRHRLLALSLIAFFVFAIEFFSRQFVNENTKKNTRCERNFFRFNGSCHRFLNCDEIANITRLNLIAEGTVKRVFLAKYRSLNVVLSELRHQQYAQDFAHNIEMLKKLSHQGRVTELIGFCGPLLVTKFYSNGDALNVPIHIDRSTNHRLKLTRICWRLCQSYIEIIDSLHNSEIGRRVMCDSNTLEKTLSQYLIDENFELVVNDLDALPDAARGKIKCGERQIIGDLVAPEQLWPYEGVPFASRLMPGYDEKVDIWKIPDICSWFLHWCHQADDLILSNLSVIFESCKAVDPRERPSSSQLLTLFNALYEMIEPVRSEL